MNTPERTLKYPVTLRVLHWLMVALIIAMIAIGYYMTGLDREDPLRGQLFGLHFSLGVTLFALAVIRLLVRLASPTPALPAALGGWELTLAKISHPLMYVLMLAIPVFGYIVVSTVSSRDGIEIFGLFSLPKLIGENRTLHEIAEVLHVWSAWLLAGVIVLHIAGALKHRFMDRPEADVLARMT